MGKSGEKSCDLFGGDIGLMALMRLLHQLLFMLGQLGLIWTFRLLIFWHV